MRLSTEGIRPSKIYVSGNPPASGEIHGVAAVPYERLVGDGPEFVVIATDQFAELKNFMGELMTLRACRYAFASFALPEISEFPRLPDPISGEPLDGQPSSGMRY